MGKMVVEKRNGSVGMNKDLAEILEVDETDEIKNPGRLKEYTVMDAIKGACVKASTELHSALTRYTWTETSAIVESVTGLAEVETWSKFHANYSRKT